ncbi:MAG: hypothetical protein LBL46_00075 [Rickettsiales bacterium]|jgi:hypothetical protein|nr:hypothetical protein [Rickettsiales bacterium]
MNISLNNAWATWIVLAVVLNLAAIVISVLKKGNNAQSIRAVAVVGTIFGSVWLGLASLIWAAIDFLVPAGVIKVPGAKKK